MPLTAPAPNSLPMSEIVVRPEPDDSANAGSPAILSSGVKIGSGSTTGFKGLKASSNEKAAGAGNPALGRASSKENVLAIYLPVATNCFPSQVAGPLAVL